MEKMALAGCVILEGRKILLLRRIKTGWFELPGGKIETGETPEQAAIREIKEELACDVDIISKLGDSDFQENGYTIGYNWYLAKILDGQRPTIGETEKFDRCEFLGLEGLGGLKLSPNMQNLIRTIDLTKIAI